MAKHQYLCGWVMAGVLDWRTTIPGLVLGLVVAFFLLDPDAVRGIALRIDAWSVVAVSLEGLFDKVNNLETKMTAALVAGLLLLARWRSRDGAGKQP